MPSNHHDMLRERAAAALAEKNEQVVEQLNHVADLMAKNRRLREHAEAMAWALSELNIMLSNLVPGEPIAIPALDAYRKECPKE